VIEREDNMQQPPLRLALALACAWCGACSTPQPARELAAQAAVAVDQAQGEVAAFVNRATRAYAARAAIVGEMSRSDLTDTSNAEFRAWLSQEAGFPGDQARIDLIHRIVDQRRTVREKLQADLDKKAAEIAGSFGEPVAVPDEKLAAAKKAFINLAQELTAEEWLKFSWKYAAQVQADLKGIAPPAAAVSPAPAASAP
jgi:hypothetical protein